MNVVARGSHSAVTLTSLPSAVNDYAHIAPVYSASMGSDYAKIFVTGLRRILESEGVYAPGLRCIDLACGAGDLALLLSSELGASVVGIDRSPEQVRAANLRRPTDGPRVSFVIGDVLSVSLPHHVDVVTISLDALNHLTGSEDWASVFRRVHAALRPGGLLVFDVNNRTRLLSDWMHPEVLINDRLTYVQCGLNWKDDGAVAMVDILMQIFASAEGRWTRHQAIVRQIAYTAERVLEMLRESGFARASCSTEFEDLRGHHVFMKNRDFFVAVRPQ